MDGGPWKAGQLLDGVEERALRDPIAFCFVGRAGEGETWEDATAFGYKGVEVGLILLFNEVPQ